VKPKKDKPLAYGKQRESPDAASRNVAKAAKVVSGHC
jgi:hypothetical protein